MDTVMMKKLILTGAVCLALGSATGAAAGGAREAKAAAPSASPAATAVPTPTPTSRPTPSPTPEPEDAALWEDGVANIMLIGVDELYGEYDRGRGDVTMLCSLNREQGTVKLVSFERSIGMPWSGHGDVMLSSTHAYGGAELLCQDISRCFNVDIDGYVQLDFSAFCRIIDALGGVEIYLDAQEAQALTEDLYYEQWFAEGDSHLNGQAALRYARLRRTDDNWRRVERQRTVVQACINKASSLGLGKIKELALMALDELETDMNPLRLAALTFSAPRFIHAQTQQLTIPDRNNVWTYNSGEETVTGCDFGVESRRLHEFIYDFTQPKALEGEAAEEQPQTQQTMSEA